MKICGKIGIRAHDQGISQKKILILFIIGFFIILIGSTILIIAAVLHDGSASFGGVVFIWFIPVAFGSGPEASWIILFAMIFAVLSVIMLLILHKQMLKTKD